MFALQRRSHVAARRIDESPLRAVCVDHVFLHALAVHKVVTRFGEHVQGRPAVLQMGKMHS